MNIINQIVRGDCLDVMAGMPDECIDMILCDLPYGTTQCKWDTIIPFEPLWEQYRRITKGRGAIVLTGSQPFTTLLIASNLKMFKYCWVWEKTQATGFFNAKIRPMVAHEDVCVFYSKQPIFNPQKTTGHKPINSYTKRASVQNRTEVYGKVTQDVSGGGETDRYPRSVLVFASDKQRTKLDGTIHPTQKPVALFEYLIKTYTNEGDLVLDNCIGSGTTALAADRLGRRFFGCDISEEYVELALRRLADDRLKRSQMEMGL